MKHWALAVAIACVLALGCSRQETTSDTSADEFATIETATVAEAPPAPSAPCDWITEAEASAALGQPSKYRSAVDDGSGNCVIDPVASGAGISVDFTVTDDPYAWQGQAQGADAQKIEGLGEEAVWTSMGTMGFIAAKKGNRAFIGMISMAGSEAERKQKAIAFGEKVVAKM